LDEKREVHCWLTSEKNDQVFTLTDAPEKNKGDSLPTREVERGNEGVATDKRPPACTVRGLPGKKNGSLTQNFRMRGRD